MEGVTYPLICRHFCVGVVVRAGVEGTWREHDDDGIRAVARVPAYSPP
jgi:hypothetical protein